MDINNHHHRRHQFLTVDNWRRRVRRNDGHCLCLFVRSIASLDVSASDASFMSSIQRGFRLPFVSLTFESCMYAVYCVQLGKMSFALSPLSLAVSVSLSIRRSVCVYVCVSVCLCVCVCTSFCVSVSVSCGGENNPEL